MSEPRRRKGRGIDAIFDSADLDLGPTTTPDSQRATAPLTAAQSTFGTEGRYRDGTLSRPDDPRTFDEDADERGDTIGDQRAIEEGREATVAVETLYSGRERGPGREPRRPLGRPPSNRQPGRELIQRGFYLEVEQDRTLDETKAALKRRGFTPDRSAIVRAALEHFGRLDRVEQEGLVRREK